MPLIRTAPLLAGLCLTLLVAEAAAQSMTPMRGRVVSFTDRFAVRVWPGNPYPHNLAMSIQVYDRDFKPIRAMTMPAHFRVTPGERRSVLVIVPFEGVRKRLVHICTRGAPVRRRGTDIAGEVCGRFVGLRSGRG